MRHVVLAVLVLSCVFLATPAAHAQGSVVIYRCTDSFGALTVQNNVPCPKGTKQDRRVIDVPPAMPAYVPARPAKPVITSEPEPVAAPVVVDAPGEPAIADADRLPPPALFRCNTYDNDSYLSEDAAPPPRCVRLETVGLDGSTDNNGGSVACQMVTDQCQRIPDGAACNAWKQRLRETEATWKFARADENDANQNDYERVRKIVRESTCGK
ncbi:MAG: DUF4124 domain-containing protein [Luteimonas sp.]